MDVDLGADAGDVQHVEGFPRRFALAMGGAEGGEVVVANEALGREMHEGCIQRLRHVPHPLGVERGGRAAVEDAIEIVACLGGEAGVEIVGDGLSLEHGEAGVHQAQMRVKRVAHGARLPRFGEIHMGDLTKRVHTGVGAAGRLDIRRAAAKGGERRHQIARHRAGIVLALPAAIKRAVIFERELVAGHL